MALGSKDGGTKKITEMDTEIKQLCKEDSIRKFEDAVQEESESLVALTKKHFWNSIILIGFFLWLLLYAIFATHPQKLILAVLAGTLLIASFERIYIQRKIKFGASKLATFSAVIEFLKNIKKNESTSNR
jgi:hypothetical protein